MLNINDNTKEILASEEIVIKDFDILAPIFNVKEELEIMTKKLDFKDYKTEVFCPIPKDI